MIWVRKLFGIFFIGVAAILVASIFVTFSQAVAYLRLLYYCLNSSCSGGVLRDTLFGIITYLFMAFMVYYLGRKGIKMLFSFKPEEAEPTTILDEGDFSHAQESKTCFRTKYGYCHVLADRIILANTKELQDISVYKEGNKIIGTLVIQLIVICSMSYYFIETSVQGDFWQMITPAIVVLVFLFSVFSSLKNSTTPLIMRDKITSVHFVKGIPYLITPHFVIRFNTNKNRKRKRIVILFDNAEKNSSEALQVFRNASLAVD